MKRTNIMLTDEQHKKLKSYAQKRRKTLGELVRESVDLTYKKANSIEQRKSVAVAAYKEGLISLGRLSEILGVDHVTARLYLKEKGIPIKVQAQEDILKDTRNA